MSDRSESAADAELKEWLDRCGPPRFDPSPVQFDVARWERAAYGSGGRPPRPAPSDGGDPPPWLRAYMEQWALPVLRYSYRLTQSADAAQRTARQVFLRLLRQGGSEAPRPTVLFQQAGRAALPSAAPDAVWHRALSRLSARDRALAALALYSGLVAPEAARQAGVSTDRLAAVLRRLQALLGQSGTAAMPAEEWIRSLEPAPSASEIKFDWEAWTQEADACARRMGFRARPRHWGWAAAAALVLAAGGYALALRTAAAAPSLPFTPTALRGGMNLLVARGTPVAFQPFGAAARGAVAAKSVAPGFQMYSVRTITAAAPSAAYRIGPIRAGLAVSRGGTALVLRAPGGVAPAVYNLAAQGQLLAGTAEPGGYFVYQFAGKAGAVRVVEEAQAAVTLAWAEGTGPHAFVHVDSGAWSPVAGQPLPTGPLGSRVLSGPPGAGAASGVLADGVLWSGSGSRWWLLPAAGPAIPLMRVVPSPSSPSHLMNVAPPYPTSTNEVIVHFPFFNDFSNPNGTQPPTQWWNLAQDRWGATAIPLEPTRFLVPLANGWVAFGLSAFASNATPPALARISAPYFVLNGLGHQLFVATLKANGGGAVTSSGTYNWATRRFARARASAPPLLANAQVLALPVWGPTWAAQQGPQQQSSLSFHGPATVALTAFSGQHHATIVLSAGERLYSMGRWLFETSASGKAAAAWPNRHGQLTWHPLNPGPAVRLSTEPQGEFVYWVANGHTYVWMPPFAWPTHG